MSEEPKRGRERRPVTAATPGSRVQQQAASAAPAVAAAGSKTSTKKKSICFDCRLCESSSAAAGPPDSPPPPQVGVIKGVEGVMQKSLVGQGADIRRMRFREGKKIIDERAYMSLELVSFAALLLAACATLRLLRRCSHKTAHKLPLPLHYASTPQVKFAYHQSGRKSDPLLVLHGFPDTASSFCPILASLSTRGKQPFA